MNEGSLVGDNVFLSPRGNSELLSLTAQIVSAIISGKTIDVPEVTSLIQKVYTALTTVHAQAPHHQALAITPAVPIPDSVQEDYIVCLEDGKRLKMLKRHLRTSYNMTPEQYRQRWKLPTNYPMVAPSYAQRRSQLAKHIGLGKRPHK